LIQFWVTLIPLVLLFYIGFYLDYHHHAKVIRAASGVSIIIVSLLVIYEFLQMLSTGFRQYISDGQNILDVVTYMGYLNLYIW
jgi:hypothetical protein